MDDNVLEECRRGDKRAFQMLFEAYKDSVYSIALHFSGDETSAKDITQQVFLKLFTQIKNFRRDSEFTTWLYRITANACIDEQRKQRRFIPLSNSAEVNAIAAKDSQEERLQQRIIAGSVRTAVAGLKPKLRMAVLLKYVEGLSYDEMADALGCSAGTVASRLNRAHKALARRLAHLRDALFSGD